MNDVKGKTPPSPGQSPFRGIEPFRLVDQQYYCGREELIGDLVNNVLLYRLIVLFGESGAGKSSLLNAGLVPELQKKGYQPERLRVRPFSDQPLLIERIECGEEPVQFLPSIFAPTASEPTFTLSLDDFDKTIESVARLPKESADRDFVKTQSPVLIFDQFEELFTLFGQAKDNSALTSERSLQEQLLNTIAGLAGDHRLRVKVILTIREDFLGKLQILTKEYPQVLDHRIRMDLLSEADAQESILYPFRDPNPFPSKLTDTLAKKLVKQLASTQPNLLVPPTQLQIVCSRLWDTYAQKTNQIDVKEFEEMGEVKGILEGFLTSQLSQLDKPLREPAVEILGNLVTESNTRDVVSRNKIRSLLDESNVPRELFSEILKSLEARRLINQVAQRDTYYFELSSEFLIEPVQKEWAQVERQRELASARAEQEDKRKKAIKQRNWALVFTVLLLIAVAASIVAAYALNLAQANERRSRQLRYVRDVANMSLAYQDLGAGNLAHVVQLLSGGLPDAAAPKTDDFRSFLWYYLWRRSHKESATLSGHSGPVNSVAFSPDGKMLASAGEDKIIKLWDLSSKQEVTPLSGHAEIVRYVAFSPDGKTLASASDDKTVKLWDVGTGKLKATLSHSCVVRSVAFSSDGKLLASVSDNQCDVRDDKTVKLWDAATRQLIVSFEDPNAVRTVAFSPDGHTLATGGPDKIVKLWDVDSRTLKTKLTEQAAGILYVAYSPDGKMLAWSVNDKIVKLWDIVAQKEQAAIKEHSDVFSLAFSPDGKMLASSGLDGAVKLRDVTRLREGATEADVATLAGHSQGVLSIAFSPDGKMMATGSSDMTVKLTDSSAWQEPSPVLADDKNIFSVAFSPDGRTIAAANDKETIKLWDVATRKELAPPLIIGDASTVSRSVAFSPDGKTLAAAVSDGTVMLWEVGPWKLIETLQGNPGGANAVAFSPDGKTFASAGYDNTVKLWDAGTRKEVLQLKGHTQGILTVAYAPDGKSLASAGYDKKVRLWDVNSGKLVDTLPERLRAVLCVAFSPDGKLLASGDFYGTVQLWDLEARKELAKLPANLGGVLSVVFSPDGKTLASAGYDNTVRLWDVATWQELATLTREPHSLYSVAFSPDSKILASAGFNKNVKLWIAATDEDVARLSK